MLFLAALRLGTERVCGGDDGISAEGEVSSSEVSTKRDLRLLVLVDGSLDVRLCDIVLLRRLDGG